LFPFLYPLEQDQTDWQIDTDDMLIVLLPSKALHGYSVDTNKKMHFATFSLLALATRASALDGLTPCALNCITGAADATECLTMCVLRPLSFHPLPLFSVLMASN
jgi:hypothetical protein